MVELETLYALRFTERTHRPVQHQPDHRQGADGPQDQRGHTARAGRAGQSVLRLRTDLLQLQPVVAHEQGQGTYVANRTTHLDVQSQPALCAQQRRTGRDEGHPAAAAETGFVGFSVFQKLGIEPEAGVDQEHAVVDAGHLHRRRRRTQQQSDRFSLVGGNAMGASEVVERTLRHHPHGAARGVRGLRHRVKGAVTADGDHGRAGGDSPGRRHLCHTGQLGGAAEQQIPGPSAGPQRSFDDFAL